MSSTEKNCLSGNNSTQQPTDQPSEMGKYSTPELQAAFDAGPSEEPKACSPTNATS